VVVQPSLGIAQVKPGQAANYVIWVWAAGRSSSGVVVRIQAAGAGVGAPHFTLCPGGSGSTCQVGGVSVSQTDELAASFDVGSGAPVGGRVELTATASAAGARSSSAWATMVVVSPASPALTSGQATTALALGSAGGDFPPLVNMPGVTPVNPTTLFPSVSPGAGSGHNPASAARHKPAEAVTTAATFPLGPLLSGGQLTGLTVLLGAIVIVFTRLSLRTRRPPDRTGKPQ
jgi:hypothetical protein